MYQKNRSTPLSAKIILSIFILSLPLCIITPKSYAEQGHMEKALIQLRVAKNSLQNAKHNKGGHRSNAIKLIDSAIEEVTAGIQSAGEKKKKKKKKNN